MDNRVTVMWCNFHSKDFLTIAGVPAGLIRNRGMTACTWLHAIQAEKVKSQILGEKVITKKIEPRVRKYIPQASRPTPTPVFF